MLALRILRADDWWDEFGKQRSDELKAAYFYKNVDFHPSFILMPNTIIPTTYFTAFIDW